MKSHKNKPSPAPAPTDPNLPSSGPRDSLDPDNPLVNVPENELRSVAPSEGTGVTGSVCQPEPLPLPTPTAPPPPAAPAP
jgi:hypothetical protein